MAEVFKKPCKRCKEPKTLDEFPLHAKFKDGHNSVCKECKRLEAKVYYVGNSTDILKRQKKHQRREILRKYNITEADYALMLNKQHGLCAICGKPPKKNKVLAVDHSHVTGKVRGLLCKRCNFMLGLANDDPSILKASLVYLKDNES